jgi:hypothetical protein
VFEDYGDNPSSLYLDHHGFVPFENPFDCVNLKFNLTSTSTSTSLIAKQGDLRERLGISASPTGCLHVSKDMLAAEKEKKKQGSTMVVSDFGMSHEVSAWLTLHHELDETVLVKCLELLDRFKGMYALVVIVYQKP